MKDDEKWFLEQCKERVGFNGEIKVTPRQIINEPGFPFHQKRAWYLLEKWCEQGIYDFGVALDMGWMLEEKTDEN